MKKAKSHRAASGGMTAPERERFARLVRETRERLQPLLPDVDAEDLDLILERMLRPWGTGQRFFIRPNKKAEGFVF